jgi:hypothetical protein
MTVDMARQKRDQMQTRRTLVPLRAFRSFDARSAFLRLRLKSLCFRHRCLASEIATDIGCGLPIQQSSIFQERDDWGLNVRRAKGHHLEGPVAVANDRRLPSEFEILDAHTQALHRSHPAASWDGALPWRDRAIASNSRA